MTEAQLIDWIRKRTKPDPHKVPLGPGDDAAVVTASRRQVVVTVDTIAEGVDFTLDSMTPRQVGRKAVAINLSDLAAMGAEPLCCVASAVLTGGLGADFARGLYEGMERIAEKFSCPLVGGDLTRWSGGVVITVTALGMPAGERAITRANARPGDRLFVTGSLGGSLERKHYSFTPRLEEAAWLARNFPPNAMIDISDGLGIDAGHIGAESGCRIVIDAARVPVSSAARRMARSGGKDALARAVSDGEDFELLLALSDREAGECLKRWPFRRKLSVIGELLEGEGVILKHADGREEGIDSEGYQHF